MNAAVRSDPVGSGGHRVPAWALALPVVVVLIAMSVGVAMVLANRSSSTVWVAAGYARVGGTAPNFTSWDLSGNKVSLSDFATRPVLLSFWATECLWCREELPAVQVLQDRYRSDGLAVLAVNYLQSSDRMRQYLAGLHVNLESVIDPEGSIASAYGVYGLPANVLLDRAGTVVRIMIGPVPIASIEGAIRQVVAPATSS